jgi:hypothetical protein
MGISKVFAHRFLSLTVVHPRLDYGWDLVRLIAVKLDQIFGNCFIEAHQGVGNGIKILAAFLASGKIYKKIQWL